MADAAPVEYVPPKVWKWEQPSGGSFASINRPVAGPTHEKALPVGTSSAAAVFTGHAQWPEGHHPARRTARRGHRGAEYDAWLIKINEGDQFGSGFVDVNPNSKIPALLDRSGAGRSACSSPAPSCCTWPRNSARSCRRIPRERAECLSWLFWQVGSAPYLGGGFGHFYVYAPVKIEYAINRFAMETKRQLDVLNRHLATNTYLAGDEYTIADIATWPWYGLLALGTVYGAAEFLQVEEYTHVRRWAASIAARPAVKRGRIVNRSFGEPHEQLAERHEARDIDAVLMKAP